MIRRLIILLLIAGCSFDPNDILGVFSTNNGYECSIYGYAKISTMIDEDSSYEDSLTVLVLTKYAGDNVHDATHLCENGYGSIELEYLMADSLGIFDSCDCGQ